jgi:hypothetical protein
MDDFERKYGLVAMQGVVKRFASIDQTGYNRVFTPEFEGGERKQPDGDAFGWSEIRFSRDLAPLTGPNDPFPRKKRLVVRERTGGMVDVKVSVEFPPEILHKMRAPGSMSQNAQEVIDNELEDCGIQVGNTVEYVCTKATTGSVDPAAVPHSMLKTDPITFPVKALAALQTFANPATNIRSTEMNRIKDEFLKAAGVPAARFISTKTVEGYITGNAELQKWAAANPTIAANVLGSSYQEGGGIERIGGLRARWVGAHYADDATPDTAVDYMTADHMVVLPAEGLRKEVMGMADGVSFVPCGLVAGDLASAVNAVRPVRGFYAYWELKGTLLILNVGRKFMPFIKCQNGVMLFDTVP